MSIPQDAYPESTHVSRKEWLHVQKRVAELFGKKDSSGSRRARNRKAKRRPRQVSGLSVFNEVMGWLGKAERAVSIILRPQPLRYP